MPGQRTNRQAVTESERESSAVMQLRRSFMGKPVNGSVERVVQARTAGCLEMEARPSVHAPAFERRHVGNVCAVTREILRMPGVWISPTGSRYKAHSRNSAAASWEVGGGRTTADRKDSKTLQEGRSPALTGAYPEQEGPVTAKASSLAQRTHEKVRVLQSKLHQAAKEDLGPTFGILYDKVCQLEVLWIAWISVQRNRRAPGVDGRTIQAIKQEGEVEFIRAIQRELVDKRYKPQHIRRVFIKKPNGKLRPLGHPGGQRSGGTRRGKAGLGTDL